MEAQWEKVSRYVEAGNLARFQIAENLDNAYLDVFYVNGSTLEEVLVKISCFGCSYFDLRRRSDHESGSAIILEAYLHTDSSLIQDLLNHKLEGKSGSLFVGGPADTTHLKHLELIGEVSINILCAEAHFDLLPAS